MMYEQYCRWDPSVVRTGDGILVGADISQEYLLPWWWNRYTRHNSFPVTWIDLGLSESMKAWCRARGALIPLRICAELFMAPKEEVSVTSTFLPQAWTRPLYTNPFQKQDTDLWTMRNAWFKKPFAMLQTPYKRTVWLDCDCEVRRNLKELFAYCSSYQISIRKDVARYPFLHYNGREFSYNTGVIAYQAGCSLFVEWAKLSIEQNKKYYTDDHLLTDIISKQKFPVCDLPDIFNRLYAASEKEENAAIFHWSGSSGKRAIQFQIAQENLANF